MGKLEREKSTYIGKLKLRMGGREAFFRSFILGMG
jgi:hypothetical protein